MDVNCPYCGAGQEINHDDDYGFIEDEIFNQDCSKCGKTFIYRTFITLDYEANKADCLNGEPHNYKPTNTFPKEYTQMRCDMCGDERRPTEYELKNILNTES